MKRIKHIQMQMQPSGMEKVLFFSSNISILLKTNLFLSELRAPVCAVPDTEKSASG